MRVFRFACLGLSAAVVFSPSNVVVRGEILHSTTWTRGTTHRIEGTVRVAAGQTLTIEPGAIVTASPGSHIVIPRTARINAQGTALEPIVFSCTAAVKFAGCWGGLVIQGFAPINTGTATSPPARGTGAAGCLETVDPDVGGSYGGCDGNDNSGLLRYARIEYAGLSLEGVGAGTQIDYVQVNRSGGNGTSVNGGTAGLRHLALTGNAGIALLWNQGWSGRAQFILVQLDLSVSGAAAGAIVGESGAPQIYNVSILTATAQAGGAPQPALLLRSGTAGTLRNVLLYRPPIGVSVGDATTCSQLASGALTLRQGIVAGAATLGDPDADPAPCGGYVSPNVESQWIQDAANLNTVITDPAQVNALVLAPEELTALDGRVQVGFVGATPPADGFFDPKATYVGAVPPHWVANLTWLLGWMAPSPPPPITPALKLIASGLGSALYVTSPPGDTLRAFVVQQSGQIRVLRRDTLLAAAFLDISGIISSGGERGLLSMAFHPNYASNGRFYVYYTDPGGTIRVARYTVSTGNPDVANPASGTVLLSIPHPSFDNHNGGLVTFGPDGYLYIGTGDGGSGGDPFGNGQDSTKLLGKILRIDVDAGTPYAIPSSNPFAGRPPAAPEVWAYGLRNPWRFSFDPVAATFYIADVGQDAWEEIDVAPAGDPGGRNYGWNAMEGAHCYSPSSGCATSGKVLPVYEFNHTTGSPTGCSIIGGYVYRGARLPAFYGRYFFSDLCGGWIRSLKMQGNTATDIVDHTAQLGSVNTPTSFGRDGRGELYITTAAGAVYRIVPQ